MNFDSFVMDWLIEVALPTTNPLGSICFRQRDNYISRNSQITGSNSEITVSAHGTENEKCARRHHTLMP